MEGSGMNPAQNSQGPVVPMSSCALSVARVSLQELEAWTTDFALPTTVWLAGFFNPQSFLTAIMQSMARKNEWPLDKMCLSVEVTKKNREDMTAPPREGSYVYGLFMEGKEGSFCLQKLPEPVLLAKTR